MPDLSNLQVKERNAEYFYESFERFYRSGDYVEACQSLWKATLAILSTIASFENKDVKTLEEAKALIQRFVQKGEVTSSEASALETVYRNRVRITGDEAMIALHIERADNLVRKLKRILKDYIINGPPRELSQSNLPGQNLQENMENYQLPENQESNQNENEGKTDSY